MGTSSTTTQGRGSRSDGSAVAFEMSDILTHRSEPTVRVHWTVVRQFTTEIPRAIWQRLDGAVGPLMDDDPRTAPLEGMLVDLEADSQILAESAVIERVVDDAETVS